MSSAKKQGEEEPIKWFVYCGVNPDALEENDFFKQIPERDRESWCCFVSYSDYLKLKDSVCLRREQKEVGK